MPVRCLLIGFGPRILTMRANVVAKSFKVQQKHTKMALFWAKNGPFLMPNASAILVCFCNPFGAFSNVAKCAKGHIFTEFLQNTGISRSFFRLQVDIWDRKEPPTLDFRWQMTAAECMVTNIQHAAYSSSAEGPY